MKVRGGVVMAVVCLTATAARADSTTSCTIGTWATYCTTSSGSGGGGNSSGIWFLGELVGAVVPVIVVSASGFGPEKPGSVAWNDVAAGWSMLPGPVGFYFGDFHGEPLDDAGKEAWKHKVQFQAAIGGGVARDATGKTAPIGAIRASIGHGRLGLDGGAELAQDQQRYSVFDGHLLLRAPPRERTSFALALGIRAVTFGGTRRVGFDIGVPHYFVLSRDDKTGQPDIMITVRPGFEFSSQGVDPHFAASLVVPVADHVALDLGGTLFGFGHAETFVAAGSLSTAL